MRIIHRTVTVLRLRQIGFYVGVMVVASMSLLMLVNIRPRQEVAIIEREQRDAFQWLLSTDETMRAKMFASGSLLQQTTTMEPTSSVMPTTTATTKTSVNELSVISLLASSMRILCIVQTTGPRHRERADMVKQTWGRRCNRLVFASDVNDPSLPAYRFAERTGREYVTFKMRTALQWAYDEEIEKFDWLLKADDDSFIVMENLLSFLSKYSPLEAHYFGRHFAVKGSGIGESFVSGAAYVLSKVTLKLLINKAFPNTSICPMPAVEDHEDVNLGYCLRNIGILPGETRDEQGRHRFLVFAPWVHLLPGTADKNNWIRTYDRHTYVEGEECCSDTAILIHYVPSGYMLAIEYLLYRLRPLGGAGAASGLSDKMKDLLPPGVDSIESLRESLTSLGYNVSSSTNSSSLLLLTQLSTSTPIMEPNLPHQPIPPESVEVSSINNDKKKKSSNSLLLAKMGKETFSQY